MTETVTPATPNPSSPGGSDLVIIVDEGERPTNLTPTLVGNGGGQRSPRTGGVKIKVQFAAPYTQKELERDTYRCAECLLVFTERTTLQAHSRLHIVDNSKPARPHTCTKCGAAFEYYAMLERHKQEHKGCFLDVKVGS
jgi:hypothetical protein